MKKNYETPSIEKVAFQYRDQVVAASGGTTCTQNWTGLSDGLTSGCRHTVANPDSGF